MSKYKFGDYVWGNDGLFSEVGHVVDIDKESAFYDIENEKGVFIFHEKQLQYAIQNPPQEGDKDYKDVSNKLPLQDIDYIALKTLGEVLGYGIEKYGYNNRKSYQHGEIDTYIGALLRHLIAYQEGEIIDKESGISHLKHLFFNAYVLVYLERLGDDCKNEEK